MLDIAEIFVEALPSALYEGFMSVASVTVDYFMHNPWMALLFVVLLLLPKKSKRYH